MMFSAVKDPGADLDYSIDWTNWLGRDSIATSSWTVDVGSGLSMHGAGVDAPGRIATVWLKDGTVGVWAVTNTIITKNDPPREDSRRIEVTVQAR